MTIHDEQQKFRNSKPSRLRHGVERPTHPFGKALASVGPKTLVEAVPKGLDDAVGVPQLVTFEHDTNDLQSAQEAAKNVARIASAISASTGAAAGLGGALSMSADIPAIIAIALRTIRDTRRAYAYAGEGPAEKLFRLQSLSSRRLMIRKNATSISPTSRS
ncbi:MAG: EcsC family protein [Parvularcula sp.]|jgi:hypothetical protein|nr:EcsC family protein [Parvularcula sp.]